MYKRQLQFYSGTQKKNLSQMERELQSLDAFLGDLKKDYGYQAEELEYGPGLFAPYFVKDKEESVEELLGGFGRLLDNLTFGGNVIPVSYTHLVFAEGETNITPAQTTEVVTPTPTPAQPPKNGLFVNEGKTYCYKNGKLVKNKYGYKVKKKYYRIDKKGVATLVRCV